MRVGRKILLRLAPLVLCVPGAAAWMPAAAQTWTVLADGDSLLSVIASDGVEASRHALALVAADGYGLASVDAATPDSSAGGTIALALGPRLVIGDVTLIGATRLPGVDVTTGWATRRGRPFASAALDADLDAAVARYAARGFADARLVARTRITPADDGLRVDVDVDVVEGAEAVIAGVELVGARRPSRTFATRVTGLAPGTPLGRFEPDAVVQSLDATGLYDTIGMPTLAREADGRVTVRVPVESGPPGAFDLVVGFLPPAGGQPGRVVGSGRLELSDPFGGGRTARIALVRNPGLVSTVDVAARDPFVAGLPVSLDVAFAGESRDSTFSRQQLRADGGVRVAPGLTLTAGVARETVLPGRAGMIGGSALPGASAIRRSSALFLGAGVRYVALDRARAPRRGVSLEAVVEGGIRRRAAVSDSLVSDSVSAQALAPRQQRLSASARVYQPLARRLVAVAGVDARVLVSGRGAGGEGTAAYDEGELFRIGGASSLRGYDEDQFLGNAVGRALAEARFLVDAVSYVFAFVDVGYVARPDLPGRAGSRRTPLGYGAGLRVATALGPVTATYALNPDLPLGRGKLHLGLSVGL